ncbi:MAG: chemotaxis protein CheW [Isosphaeraceae bacterium]|nr:chemotaxis protein CheW [Isosphaeraceae bacterium]
MEVGDAGLEIDQERIDSYVVFQLGEENYALDVARVREVLDVGTLTRVPGASRALYGLCNLRGHVVPIWDLRIPFHLGDEGRQDRMRCVLMVEPEAGQSGRLAGLLVDRVSDVLDLLPGEVQPPPALGLGGGSAFVRGLIRHQGRFLLILDLDRIFAALDHESAPEVP